MNKSPLGIFALGLLLFLALNPAWAGEPRVQILSPADGSRITQDKNSVLISGKVMREAGRASNVDILLVIDVSGSTALYAGADLGEADQPPESSGFSTPQIFIGGMSVGGPPLRNPRNSILAAEIAAARRLLVQLNAEATRVGVLTFGENAKLVQPLTHDFERIR
ncbi:MAG TPA: VWA domain-containing protein, partial [Candidatus Binatia bacterium]|nr:VWA domain-containing protein [Candidatus Binatia bacterium]